MIEENNISPMYSDFDQIKKLEEDGQEYWTSRELCNALGYSTYQKFTRILNKAIAVANGKGMKTADHFNQTVEMVKLGSGTFREVENMHLSRMACLIIAENADGKKPQVQIAREYFKQEVSPAELAVVPSALTRISINSASPVVLPSGSATILSIRAVCVMISVSASLK